MTIRNSIGNVIEIIDKLDKDQYNQVQLEENYEMLKQKWGEMIVFGDEAAGISIKYIDVGEALFSGLMVTFTTLTIIFLAIAIIFGKIILPILAKVYQDSNEQLVDIATLKTMENVNEMSGKKNKKTKKEWF